MNIAVIASLMACLTFALAGPHLTRAMAPHLAVRLLVPSALLAAVATVFVLGTVAFTWIGQLAEVAEYGTWSPHTLRLLDPIPAPVAVTTGALLVPVALCALGNAVHTGRALLAVHRACRHLHNTDGSPFVIVDSEQPQAFTTPGLRPRTVITTGMLAALDGPGRRVLMAHERSHRDHRHTCWTLTADLAAAVNPLLRPTARAVREATERWADEDAARSSDRRQVAATIAQVALMGTHTPAPNVVAAAAGGQVTRRVVALLQPAPRTRACHLAALVALTLAVAAGALAVAHTGENLFEHAEPTASARQAPPVGTG
ncbi:M56 family metallopeptidase [Rugosimonospora africana]|uniref:Peptidase M48 n=1 Tax=Rugosimonospora africana TaxID=556532 RepID=A0A8J3QR85_9ACTN|nr:M56 family metallopeptidase [Rugosimonospora africana]GIH15960.1 peptidase M48 [Rugosimonospora africana]